MTSKNKLVKKAVIVFGALIILFVISLHGMEWFISRGANDKVGFNSKWKESLIMEDISFDSKSTMVVRSVVLDSMKQTIVFIHGAPGDWTAFQSLLTNESLLAKYNLIGYTRPGYDPAAIRNARPLLSDQAETLVHLINHYHLTKVHLVGHSYGGPIGAYLAASKLIDVKSLTLIASVNDPKNEKIFWFSYPSFWTLTRWMLPISMQVAGIEKKTHALELLQLDNILTRISCPVMVMHSYDDYLAPGKENISYLKQKLSHQSVVYHLYKDKGHIFLFTEPEIVVKALLDFIQ